MNDGGAAGGAGEDECGVGGGGGGGRATVESGDSFLPALIIKKVAVISTGDLPTLCSVIDKTKVGPSLVSRVIVTGTTSGYSVGVGPHWSLHIFSSLFIGHSLGSCSACSD